MKYNNLKKNKLTNKQSSNFFSHPYERTPSTPPKIDPLPIIQNRPLVSVMIPTFNCYRFIEKALTSVLDQDMGVHLMQIEVVDDYSQDGDVEELVNNIGHGRVTFFQQSSNKGSLRNFETCINRAKGEWIHILHGDDYVLPGFYNHLLNLISIYPNVGAAFTNNYYLSEDENELETEIKVSDKSGIVENWLFKIAAWNKLQPPAIMVKRSVYEKLGSFFAVHYGEDWEMWTRIAAHYPCAYIPEPLAVYRKHSTNISSKAISNRYIIKDISKVISIIQNYLPENKKRELLLKSKKRFSQFFLYLAYTNYIKNRNFNRFSRQLIDIFYFDPRIENVFEILKTFIKYTIKPKV